MFTGIIEHVGRVRSAAKSPAGLRLEVSPEGWGHVNRVGDSVAVNGVCLTVAADPTGSAGMLVFDVVPETLAKTTLGGLVAGSRVHLEQAATAGTLLGGHIVQGHVDGVGEVVKVWKGEGGTEQRVRIRVSGELMGYMAPKGSVAVDGVSLTIAASDPGAGCFEVALIPTTLEKTLLGGMKEGDRCNVEADVMAKTVVHYLKHFVGGSGGRPTAC